ncbi:MAG: M16 family metallopeptidase [bacterium]
MYRLFYLSSLLFTLSSAGIFPSYAEDKIWWGYLGCGAEAVVVENHSVPMVSGSIIIKAGAQEETWQTWGAAHLLEHLIFNGTKTLTQEALYDTLDRLGVYYNAHTGRHFTHFLVLSHRDNFPPAFTILSEMVFASEFSEKQFTKEKGIVKEEIARERTGGDDEDRLWQEVVLGYSPLSREVLGTVESISRLERDSVLTFYRNWYHPTNSLFFIIGDVRIDTIPRWLDKITSPYPLKETPAHRPVIPPDWEALRSLGIIERQGDILAPRLFFIHPAPSMVDAEYLSFRVGLNILFRRVKEAFAGQLQSDYQLLTYPEMTILAFSLSPLDTLSWAKLRERFQKELMIQLQKDFSADEIAREADEFRRQRIFSAERLHYFAIQYASDWVLAGWQRFLAWEREAAELAARPDRVSEVLKRWIVPDYSVTIALRPWSSEDKRDTTLQSLTDTTLYSYPLIRERTTGGWEIAVRQDPSAKVFALHILFPHRWWWDRQFGNGSVDLLHRIWQKTASPGGDLYSYAQELGISIKCSDDLSIPYDDYYSLPDFSYIRIESYSDRWQEVVQFMGNLLLSHLDSLQLSEAKQEVEEGYSRSISSPRKVGSRRLRHLLYGELSPQSQVIYSPSVEIPIIELNRLRQELLNTPGVIITAVSSADPLKVGEKLKEEWEKIASHAGRTLRAVNLPRWSQWREGNVSPMERDTVAMGRSQGALVMGKRWESIPEEDVPILAVVDRWFSQEMAQIVREKKGLAYELGSSAILYPDDQGGVWGWWEIVVGTRVQNLPQTEKEVKQIISQLQRHKFTERELKKTAAIMVRSLLMREMSRMSQAYQMGMGIAYWNDPFHLQKLISRFSQVTPESVQRVARRYFSPEGLKVVWVK